MRILVYLLLLLASPLVLLRVVSPAAVLNAAIPKRGLAITRGLAYGPLPRQRLDLYRPVAAEGPLPAVVFFYGGAWDKGRRQDYLFAAESLASAGFLVAVPDYRLFPAVRFPAFLEDCAKAVAWVRREIGAHGGDGSRLALVGHSAGAYNAAFLALDPRWLAAEGLTPGALAGVVGLAGPYGFNPLDYDSTRPIFAVGLPVAALQPLSYVNLAAPPFLLLHGAADRDVYPQNSERLAAALAEAGVPVGLTCHPRLAHIGIVLALARGFRGKAPIRRQAVEFLRQVTAPR